MLGFAPLGTVSREAPRSDQHMDMRMILHGARPGVQDREAAEASADIAGIAGELLQRGGGRAHEQAVDFFLMRKRKRTKRLRQREGNQIVPARQQTGALLFDPALGLFPVTLGAAAIAAGMIDVDLAPAVITLIDMASKVRRPTRLDVVEGQGVTVG